MPEVTRIHHIGIVVPETEEALSFWRDALGLKLERMEEVPQQETRVAFLPVRETEVELLEPTTTTSGMAKFMEKRGAGMHHICLEVDDIEGMMQILKEKGIRLLSEEPETGAGGKKMVFIHPRSANGVLVELYQA